MRHTAEQAWGARPLSLSPVGCRGQPARGLEPRTEVWAAGLDEGEMSSKGKGKAWRWAEEPRPPDVGSRMVADVTLRLLCAQPLC